MLLRGIVRRLFENEDSPRRFEDACRDLVANADQIILVPTSPTWDLGRDARNISPTPEGPSTVLLASLTAKLDDKIHADIQRVSDTTRAETLYYCSSQPLTELACDQLAAEIKAAHPTARAVTVLGQHQLAGLVNNDSREQIIRNYYGAEIKNIEDALLREPSPATDPEHLGLRLAMITQTGDDARELRGELARRLILESLYPLPPPQLPGEIAQAISRQLHLPRSISADYIQAQAAALQEANLVSVHSDGRLELTSLGREEARSVPNLEEASGRLLEGREAVREALERLSGHQLSDDEYDVLWAALQDQLSHLFYSQGTSIVRMIDSLLVGKASDESPKLVLQDLAASVTSHFHETRRDDIYTAVIDMFSDRESDAFAWLTNVSTTYVMMCTLGLENLSAGEVEQVVANLTLATDSDLVLSVLCEREDNHQEVLRIVNSWRALGGKLAVPVPVLEEVAYHAWIANASYAELEDQLGSISDGDASTDIDNAFVRTFRRLSPDNLGRRMWRSYVNQFCGLRPYDYGNVLDVLRDELNFAVLAAPGDSQKEFATEVFRFLLRLASEEFDCDREELGNKVSDKCRRDALLLAAVLAAREKTREAGLRTTTIVVSSARLMKEADVAFRSTLGQPEAVLSTAAVACLLALTPGVRMNLATLRGVLFDIALARRITPLQQFALRIISRSREFDLPLSRRVSLQKELERRILFDAERRDEPVRAVRRRLVTMKDPDYTASVVADALDALAVRSTGADAMRQEIKDLTSQLSDERTKARADRSRPKTQGYLPNVRPSKPDDRKKNRRQGKR